MSARRCRRFWACHSHVISFNNTITAIFIIFAVITAVISAISMSSLGKSCLLSGSTHSRRWATRSAPDHHYWRAVSQSPELPNNIVFTVTQGFVFHISYL